ncbi:D-alanyl-D-alanine carboxypeptidase [Lacihabitans sp. CCS-44]|uniref:D-alanyl-D-alanine carboxypeptidase/D-alanyl-D-alanine-endopeptidase n=1 Tax=Lacihabitans sp. CCS-44 TaxID=2487331 RepID=UPI0020CED86F|nr:D-alanyl-D-alanine carboxypeptidase [Lacihabitans sp. CCS-44]MCP9756499.1 D-alanyl-D-alanine carboxypeptidase [Lacihabitans sp. CCS-44]
MKSLIRFSFLAFISLSCITQKSKTSPVQKWLNASELENNGFVGIKIFDPKTQEVIFAKNEKHYFVPASNTKILSLYASLKNIGDSIPALKYALKNDSLFVSGTADPTLLHPDLPSSKTFDFLKNSPAKTIVFSDANFKNEVYGPGWAWDDYNDYYQAELSSFPIYGNIVRFKKTNNELSISPSIFSDSLFFSQNSFSEIKRNIDGNTFYTTPKTTQKSNFEQDIPFKTSFSLLQKLLSDTLKKEVTQKSFMPNKDFKTLYSLPVDTVLRRMMQISDNMLAEQLLLLSGGKYSDTISTSLTIKNIQKDLLADIPQRFNWADGSGLSRYNLVTPEGLVFLLDRMLKEFPKNRLFSLMSIGGQVGTLKNAYKSGVPFVFAKTGSLSGVYNQSGYLITKSGRILIFSFMNNNFVGSGTKVRIKTSEIVTFLHENY